MSAMCVLICKQTRDNYMQLVDSEYKCIGRMVLSTKIYYRPPSACSYYKNKER